MDLGFALEQSLDLIKALPLLCSFQVWDAPKL